MRSLVPGYHGNHVNPHASDTTIIITIGNSGSIQEHKYCTEWETFWFALPGLESIYGKGGTRLR